MSWITDLLQDIPLSAVLREKIGLIETKYQTAETQIASLKSENESLKESNAQLETENVQLKKQIASLAHTDELLDEIDVNILRIIGLSKYNQPWADFIAEELQLHVEEVKYHLNKLESAKYILSADYGDGIWQYSFRDKGREYAIKNKLL